MPTADTHDGVTSRPLGTPTDEGASDSPATPRDRTRCPRLAVPVAVAVVVVVGLALRLWILNSNLGAIDSDEAAGGLIARHFQQGDSSIFLWGNVYGGTLEAVLAVPLFALFGSSTVAWKSIMILMYGTACVLTWRIGLRTVGPDAARLAGALLWIASAPLVLISTKGRLYYGAALVLICAAVLLCLRLSERRSRLDMAVLGLVTGLGLWTAPFVFYVVLPALVWLAVGRPRRILDAPLAIPGFLLGAAPWLAYNLRNHWQSLDERPPGIITTYWERFNGFFTDLLPRLLGLRSYWGPWRLGAAGHVVYLAVVAGLIGFIVAVAVSLVRRRNTPDADGPGPGSRRGLSLVALVLVTFPFLFAIPEASWYVEEPRYGLFLAPALALVVAAGVTRLNARPPVALAAVALAAVASWGGLHQMMDFSRANPGHWDLAPPEVSALGHALQERGITTVVADYWIGYALTFETEERVIATPTGTVRYLPYDRQVRAAGAIDYVLFPLSPDARALEDKARKQGVGFRTEDLGGFLLYRLDRPLT